MEPNIHVNDVTLIKKVDYNDLNVIRINGVFDGYLKCINIDLKNNGFEIIQIKDIKLITESYNVRANFAVAASSANDWIGASPSFNNAIEHKSIFVSIICPFV